MTISYKQLYKLDYICSSSLSCPISAHFFSCIVPCFWFLVLSTTQLLLPYPAWKLHFRPKWQKSFLINYCNFFQFSRENIFVPYSDQSNLQSIPSGIALPILYWSFLRVVIILLNVVHIKEIYYLSHLDRLNCVHIVCEPTKRSLTRQCYKFLVFLEHQVKT